MGFTFEDLQCESHQFVEEEACFALCHNFIEHLHWTPLAMLIFCHTIMFIVIYLISFIFLSFSFYSFPFLSFLFIYFSCSLSIFTKKITLEKWRKQNLKGNPWRLVVPILLSFSCVPGPSSSCTYSLHPPFQSKICILILKKSY